MSQFRMMNKKVIKLFDEKSRDVTRTFCFSNSKEFYAFVKGFKEMKYNEYGWRYKDKRGKKGKNNLVNHFMKR
jgi:hypothetical protein